MELPSEESLRWLVSRYARLLGAHGDGIGRPELVLPTGDFFPDEFTLDPAGVMRVTARILSHAPVRGDLDVKIAFVDEDSEHGGGGDCGAGACGTGACGTGGKGAGVTGGSALETEDGYAITLGVRDAASPVLLTTALARGAGGIVLFEAGEDIDADDAGAMSELAAAACGFGALLTAGAYVYGKSCGGVNVRQATHLTVSEHAALLALFCRVNDRTASDARAHLGATAKEALDDALRWVDSNGALVDALRTHPASLADGVFRIAPVKGLLGRLFTKRAPRDEELLAPPPSSAKKKQRSEAELRRLAEAKALVEEALRTR